MNKTFIDSFLFFNEVDLLKVRLAYLGPIIESFVIIESNVDFSGKSKPYILEQYLLELPFANKIIYFKTEINLQSFSWTLKKIRWFTRPRKFLWKIQDSQRKAIREAIQTNVKVIPDFILMGDLDEIPNYQTLDSIRSGKIVVNEVKSFRQRLFNYRTDISSRKEEWRGTLCLPANLFFDKLPHVWRSLRENLPFIQNGGFHFSYFMSTDKIQKKLQAISDVENLSQFKNLNAIQISEAINMGNDLFRRDIGLTQQSGMIPNDLEEILHKYLPSQVIRS